MPFSSSVRSVDPVTGSPIGIDFVGTSGEDFFGWADAANSLTRLPMSVGVYGQEGNDNFGVVPLSSEPLFGVELHGGLGDDVFLIAAQTNSRAKPKKIRGGRSKIFAVREQPGEGSDFLSLQNLDNKVTISAIPNSSAYDGLDVVRVFSPAHKLVVFVTEDVDRIRIGDLSGRSADFTFEQLFDAASN